jgi:hypothetical protein
MDEDEMEILIPIDLSSNINKLADTKFTPVQGEYDKEELKKNIKYISNITCEGLWYWDRYSKKDNKERVICVGGSLNYTDPIIKETKTIKLSYLEGYISIEHILLYKKGDIINVHSKLNPVCYREDKFDQDKEPYKSATEQLKVAVSSNEWILLEDIPVTLKKDDFVNVRCRCYGIMTDIVELNIPVTSIVGIENTGIWGDIELLQDYKDIYISHLTIGPIATLEDTKETMIIGNNINNNFNYDSLELIGKLQIGTLTSLARKLIKPVTSVSKQALSKLKKLPASLSKLGKSGSKKISKLKEKAGKGLTDFKEEVKKKAPGAIIDVGVAGLSGAAYTTASGGSKKLIEDEDKKDKKDKNGKETKQEENEENEKQVKEENEQTKDDEQEISSLIRYDINYTR